MSYLTFHTRRAEIRLAGGEAQHIASQAIDALVRELDHDYGPVLRALGLDGSPDSIPHLRYLIGGGIVDIPTGLPQRPTVQVDLFNLALDVWVTHRPEARVLAWLYHGCGRHVWIDGSDRGMFAARLRQALDAGLARQNLASPFYGGNRVGWEEIITWLWAGQDPVVTSTDVCDSFPDRYLAIDAHVWHPDATGDDQDDDPWDRLDHGDQWDLCMRALTKLQPSRQWRADDDIWWSPFTLARLDGALRQAERYTATVGAGRG